MRCSSRPQQASCALRSSAQRYQRFVISVLPQESFILYTRLCVSAAKKVLAGEASSRVKKKRTVRLETGHAPEASVVSTAR